MKPALTISQQIELLESRKLGFEDKDKAKDYLFKYNYYRLSGYWRKYQIDPNKHNDTFKDNTTFEQIIAIYELDALLAKLLLEGIRIFEVCLRTRFAYYTALTDVPEAPLLYSKQTSYNNKISQNEKPEELRKKIDMEINRSYDKKERSIVHYIEKEKGKIPVWVAVEVLSFNTVSRMYSRWKNEKTIEEINASFNYFFKSYKSLKNTIECLVLLRNLCAHQSRIWNKKLTKRIGEEMVYRTAGEIYLSDIKSTNDTSQWRIIIILMALVDKINKHEKYSARVKELCCTKNKEFYEGLIHPDLKNFAT